MAEGEQDAIAEQRQKLADTAAACLQKLDALDKQIRPEGAFLPSAVPEGGVAEVTAALRTVTAPGADREALLTAFADGGGLHLAAELLELTPPTYLDDGDAGEQHALAIQLLEVLALWPRAYSYHSQWVTQLEGEPAEHLPPECSGMRRILALMRAAASGGSRWREEVVEHCLAVLGEGVCGDRHVALFKELGGPALVLDAIQCLQRRRTEVEATVTEESRALETLPELQGATLTGASVYCADGQAAAVGLRAGMRLTSVGRTPVATVEEATAALKAAETGKITLAFTPAPLLTPLAF